MVLRFDNSPRGLVSIQNQPTCWPPVLMHDIEYDLAGPDDESGCMADVKCECDPPKLVELTRDLDRAAALVDTSLTGQITEAIVYVATCEEDANLLVEGCRVTH
jgi:hypothetical protein